ncbi:MAG: winged helix-turn-helix transcriptional regulator [Thermoplasmata archaeon]
MNRVPLPVLPCPCPPSGLIDLVGKKWAICVVTLLGCHGALRFGRIQTALPAVSPATLTSTLRALEREMVIERLPVTGDRRASGLYALTPRGTALHRSLLPLAGWLRDSRGNVAERRRQRDRRGHVPSALP